MSKKKNKDKNDKTQATHKKKFSLTDWFFSNGDQNKKQESPKLNNEPKIAKQTTITTTKTSFSLSDLTSEEQKEVFGYTQNIVTYVRRTSDEVFGSTNNNNQLFTSDPSGNFFNSDKKYDQNDHSSPLSIGYVYENPHSLKQISYSKSMHHISRKTKNDIPKQSIPNSKSTENLSDKVNNNDYSPPSNHKISKKYSLPGCEYNYIDKNQTVNKDDSILSFGSNKSIPNSKSMHSISNKYNNFHHSNGGKEFTSKENKFDCNSEDENYSCEFQFTKTIGDVENSGN